MRGLKAAAGFSVEICEQRSLGFLSPERTGGIVLRIRYGTPLRVKRAIEIYFIARALSSTPLTPSVALGIGIAAVLPLRDATTRGSEHVTRVFQELRVALSAAVSPQAFSYAAAVAAQLLVQTARIDRETGSPISAGGEEQRLIGVELRHAGLYADSERAFRRAAALAEGDGDWTTVARSWAGLAKARTERNQLASARYYLEHALEQARSHGANEGVALLLMDLFLNAVDAAQYRRAERLARESFEALAALSHPRLPMLVHDVARYWLRTGGATWALPVLEAVVGQVPDAAERLMVWGNVARAAGAARNPDKFTAALNRITAAASEPSASHVIAHALLGAAYGALELGREREAQTLARQSLEHAVAKGQTSAASEAADIARLARPAGEPDVRSSRRSALALEMLSHLGARAA